MRKVLQIKDRSSKAVQRRRFLRKQSSRKKKKFRNLLGSSSSQETEIRISAPFAFNITGKKNRKHFLRFIRKLENIIIDRVCKVVIDFKETQYLASSAMLLFVAELDRAKRIRGSRFNVTILPSDTSRINQVLHQVGIYSLCNGGAEISDEPGFDETVKHWRYATGQRVNENTTKAFDKIEGRMSAQLKSGMWKSLSEAVVNSVEHAYLEARGTTSTRLGHSRWWMFSQEKDNVLTVAVCDLGIGIPRSLPLRWAPNALQKLLDSMTGEGQDLRAIRAALQVGASSTGASHRGRGLAQIWAELRNVDGASLMILTNKAMLFWNAKEKREYALQYSESIFGTMIVWEVPTQSQDGEVSND